MGSTSGSERNFVHTLSPIRNMVKQGRFIEAQRSLSSFETSSTNVEASLLDAVCWYRLGDATALEQFYKDYDAKLTLDQRRLAFRHEVLGHLCAKPQRLDEAMKLLSQSVNAEGHRDLGKLWSILRALREGQQSARVSRHPYYGKGGLRAPVAVRSDYLSDAAKACKQVSDKNAPVDGEESSLIGVISDYMLLRIELRMSSDIRDKATIRLLRRRLSVVDKGVKDSLPSWIFTRLAQYQRSF